MTQASYEQAAGVVVLPTAEVPVVATLEVRRNRWHSLLIALGGLVLVYGVALCVMVAGGVVVHAVDPARRLDIFAALHNQWVVAVLVGTAVLWLLPPHPWEKRVVVAPGSGEQPASTAGGAEDGDADVVTVHRDGPGPGTVPRPAEDGTGGTSPLGDS